MAIAFDTASLGLNATVLNTVTFAGPNVGSGANRILFLGIEQDTTGSDEISSVTWNGTTMTRTLFYNAPSGLLCWIYHLVNPASGANNFVVNTVTAVVTLRWSAAAYTGAKQTGVPDATATEETTSATEVSPTVTVVAANSWVAMFAKNNSGNFSAGTSTTLRTSAASYGWFDMNADQAAGARTIQGTWSGSSTGDAIGVSFAPAVSTNSGASFLLSMI